MTRPVTDPPARPVVGGGLVLPLVTPVGPDGAVSEPCVRALIGAARSGVAALMPAISCGEGWRLSAEQWRAMVEFTVRHADGLPCLVGAQVATAAEAVERAAVAADLGADAVVVAPPMGGPASPEAVYGHFATVAAASELPVFVYNESAVSGNRIDRETLIRILRLDRVVGMKESSRSPETTLALVREAADTPVFQGWEDLMLDTPGAAGLVAPLAHLDAGLCGALLRDRSPARQAAVTAACHRYGLFGDDYVLRVKAELFRRGVIAHPGPV
ncbi:dihydrodipicolinate synthase family protein [Kitasatospora sp. NPDC057904]|uniref:dihydrodipicolinate synthase family protein n=1 Tax=Kitasatospora sp. NPDC057904 TaxID=3346275 RepID=UPI0036DBF3A5